MSEHKKFERAADALSYLYKRCGTWGKTAELLGSVVTGAFLWKVVNDDAKSDVVHDALADLGYMEPRPHLVPVPACPVCGEVHGLKRTCPDELRPDPRRRRAWAGTEAEAERLDNKLSELGYRSLREYVDERLL